ncbi:MAG: nucleotidyl transferase AbiEii/AbiGii toxin family protein [Planctomycetes bacterium]|nr:nucleotidyl transferase AbiEii/AbiGii toxin family protein [Planctomycetota bacterium]
MDDRGPSAHLDRELFRESVRNTAASTGFLARLVEKDYFCTVLLAHLSRNAPELVFKGGTCLAKVHVGFYRMSEDLDFVISTPSGSKPAMRKALVKNAKRAVQTIEAELSGLRALGELAGANNSTQYAVEVQYDSALGKHSESIHVEVALREELLLPAARLPARTMLLDPFTREPAVDPIELTCIARVEALAEKARAALSRRTPAIRDFYDIDHVVRRGELDARDAGFRALVTRKLAIPGNSAIDVSAERLAALRLQVETELRPVLRDQDFESFDLERAFLVVRDLAAAIAEG